ncbi:hypothetical protein BDK51DRAFT_16185 [Blyttiomyces helicus]|uniref:G protein gamma domain-containing protein n=1 Tax=Blyttiomyces helicus TaxID=388810 RepID=A0A4P9WGX0_9FUNG|nr:hypothetical protein BDK51DRAFT_16185 [Blyttiomyces helicus]|eukprot:RKO91602.1 hypothetical protein BDK51DRAFT_16185 [Blyttiomyces helicus]
MSELKLRKLYSFVAEMRKEETRPRILASHAIADLIHYSQTTRDPLLPSPLSKADRKDDPFTTDRQGSCLDTCTIS